jgi:hypothetical protein
MDLDQYNRVDLEHIIERQRPVIEAAKAAKDEIDYILKLATKLGVDYPFTSELFEALQAAERGE